LIARQSDKQTDNMAANDTREGI